MINFSPPFSYSNRPFEEHSITAYFPSGSSHPGAFSFSGRHFAGAARPEGLRSGAQKTFLAAFSINIILFFFQFADSVSEKRNRINVGRNDR